MEGGAINAEFLLRQLKHPTRSSDMLMTQDERERCIEIVSKHDQWKSGAAHPIGSDRFAVVCLEGDALCPLNPLGRLADLERPDDAKKEVPLDDNS
ncbi:hypothetical protein ES708_02671 [subsurface metagenome]